MNRATNSTGVITQEDFEWFAMEACAVKDRLVTLYDDLNSHERLKNKEIVVDDVETALRLVGLTEEAVGLNEWTQDVAQRLEDLEMPKGIWVRHARKDAPSARLKLFNTAVAPALKVELEPEPEPEPEEDEEDEAPLQTDETGPDVSSE